mgnify:CR=1 FL=1
MRPVAMDTATMESRSVSGEGGSLRDKGGEGLLLAVREET